MSLQDEHRSSHRRTAQQLPSDHHTLTMLCTSSARFASLNPPKSNPNLACILLSLSWPIESCHSRFIVGSRWRNNVALHSVVWPTRSACMISTASPRFWAFTAEDFLNAVISLPFEVAPAYFSGSSSSSRLKVCKYTLPLALLWHSKRFSSPVTIVFVVQAFEHSCYVLMSDFLQSSGRSLFFPTASFSSSSILKFWRALSQHKNSFFACKGYSLLSALLALLVSGSESWVRSCTINLDFLSLKF